LIEKGYQIGFMTDIYFHASTVICWLGEEADDSDVALFLLGEVGRTQDTPAYDAVDILKDATCSRFAEPLEKIFASAWWSRAWILQEVSLGKNLLMYCNLQWTIYILETRPYAMKSPGSWRELAPRAYRKPLGRLLEAYRERLGKLLGDL
jgi:hypothetical protein